MKTENKISIITAVYNGESTLERLIQSIINQEDKSFEFIVVDGCSKDRTSEILRKYDAYIDRWISEPDNGIYDAWNKGVRMASGDWIMFLGCDDMLLPKAIFHYREFLKNMDNSESMELVSSRLEMVDLQGKLVRVKGWSWEWPTYLKEVTIAHPGALHSRRFFVKYGLFDTSYKIVGDFELLIRPKGKLITAFMDKITVRMSEGGASDSVPALLEHYRAATETGGYSKLLGAINLCVVYTKLVLKRFFRGLGWNVYIKK